MGTTKTTDYIEEHLQLADWMKALAHPARIAIVSYLSKRNSCVCGELVDFLPLSQATVSQHLKALKEAGIIQGEVEGTKSCYCLNPKKLNHIQKVLGDYLQSLRTDLNNCCSNE
ncbi:MAG: winged helix-turn-helix transcriptional regulator [Flavobacteriaceae bacterium]|nr:winged helix-turn-helix transcriptional regulator [Flavobacteriaceae bacterium]NVJ72569.1 winged helix-turn-helix transcriptional regulator [Flavobacteriaceae bacterium]